MVLKRKRSDPELCSSPSSASSFGSPLSNNGSTAVVDITFPRVLFGSGPGASATSTPAHLHSRTMKRFRNSRPSEDEVHQRTLGLLYSAQQRQPQQQFLNTEQHEPQVHGTTTISSQQQSLHHFWNIGPAPVRISHLPASALRQTTTPSGSCDDCGGDLAGDNDMQIDDCMALEAAACGACGKHVCFSCSVSNLGEEKRCLQCAGRSA